jgi:hypothetical protein
LGGEHGGDRMSDAAGRVVRVGYIGFGAIGVTVPTSILLRADEVIE